MRKVTIELFFEGGPEQGGSYVHNISENLFHVYVDPKEAAEYHAPLWSIAAHELGHVVGRAFGLPQHAGMLFYGGGPDAIPREEEAWKVAEEIVKGLREMSLRSYRREDFTYDKLG